MKEIVPSGFNNFIIPFMIGMIFVLTWSIVGAIRIIAELSKEDRKKFFLSLLNPKILMKNVKDWFNDCLFHVKLWKRNKLLGYMHSSIAFGWFMLIVIGHIEVWLYTPERIHRIWYPIFFRYFVSVSDYTMKGSFFFFLMDFFLLIVLSGILLAIIKRLQSQLFGMKRTTKPTLTDRIGLYSLWSIFPLRLLAESFTADISGGSFLTKSLNSMLHTFFSNEMNILPAWWAYSIALGTFFCVLPFSRYMHIVAEILLIPMRNAGVKIDKARKGMVKLQVYSCPSCGVCIDACPLSSVTKTRESTTVYLNRQIKRYNKEQVNKITDTCLMCGSCTTVCPVGVQGDTIRLAQRKSRHYNLSHDYSTINTNNDIKCSETEILYFGGCMSDLSPSINKSFTSILDKAGIAYKRMDENSTICCGRPMLLAGREDAAKQLIEENKEIILSSGARTLVLSCPICYRIFKENYNLEGIEVLHHTEYIDRLIIHNKIIITKSTLKYVYHDPCELGRGSSIYEQPRDVISSIGTLVEAQKTGKESICCGGSLGSLSLNHENRKGLTQHSLNNLTAASPDAIITACPLCKITFNRYANMPVMDIAELIDKNSN